MTLPVIDFGIRYVYRQIHPYRWTFDAACGCRIVQYQKIPYVDADRIVLYVKDFDCAIHKPYVAPCRLDEATGRSNNG